MKYGIDPTSPHVHLGHTVPLRILRAFQDEGHKAQIVIGDYTASLGDPTGRDEMRDGMSLQEARANGRKYIEQISKVIDTSPEKCEIVLNSGWLERRDLRWVLDKLQNFTVQQITNRDDFKKRLDGGVGVHLSELMYPILQGQDSVELFSDVELGGNEQLFTLLLARSMQAQAGQPSQVCITLPILRGLDGKRRMGKSLGNFIGINEDPTEMFGKVMSIPDDLMPEWFNLLTDMNFEASAHPMAQKQALAGDIVRQFHGGEAASIALDTWTKQFSERQAPTDIQEMEVPYDETTLTHLVWSCQFARSKGDARRLVMQGAIVVDGVKVKDPMGRITPVVGMVIKCSRHYVKIK